MRKQEYPRSTVLKRYVAFVTLTAFFLTNHFDQNLFAAPQPVPAVTGEVFSFPEDIAEVRIPKALGKIEDRFKGTDSRTVIVIQDAHEIPAAQKSIFKGIRHFLKQYGVSVVGLEGANAELNPQIFQSFPDKKRLKQVFKEYFNNGELSGGNAAALFSGISGEVLFSGVEDWTLYEKGLELFLEAMEAETILRERVEAAQKTLNEEKTKSYSEKLFGIDQRWNAFEENQGNLIEILKMMAEVKRPEPGSELAVLLSESEQGGKDSAAAEREVKDLAGKIQSALQTSALPKDQKQKTIMEFQEKLQQFKTSELTSQAFALFLKQTAAKNNIPVQVSKSLLSGMKKQQTMKQIEGTRFFKDLEQYVQSVKTSLMDKPEQRILDQKTRELQLAAKLLKLELSRDEWNDVKNRNQKQGVSPEAAAIIEQAEAHRAFYENAESRDQAFLNNMERIWKGSSKENRGNILVAGGFHAQGLTQRLKEKNISYVLVMPRISEVPENTNYLKHMQGDLSWKDYFEDEGGRIYLYKAFVRSTRDKLLEGETEDFKRGVVLKDWRDQIIRDLADKKQIENAKDYTQFLDEVSGVGGSGFVSEAKKKAQAFINGLRTLDSEKRLNEETIFKLLSPATVPTTTGGIGDRTASVRSGMFRAARAGRPSRRTREGVLTGRSRAEARMAAAGVGTRASLEEQLRQLNGQLAGLIRPNQQAERDDLLNQIDGVQWLIDRQNMSQVFDAIALVEGDYRAPAAAVDISASLEEQLVQLNRQLANFSGVNQQAEREDLLSQIAGVEWLIERQRLSGIFASIARIEANYPKSSSRMVPLRSGTSTRAEARSSSLFPDGMPEGAAIGGISGYVLSGGDSEVTGIGAAAGAVLGMFFLDDDSHEEARRQASDAEDEQRRKAAALTGPIAAPAVSVAPVVPPVAPARLYEKKHAVASGDDKKGVWPANPYTGTSGGTDPTYVYWPQFTKNLIAKIRATAPAGANFSLMEKALEYHIDGLRVFYSGDSFNRPLEEKLDAAAAEAQFPGFTFTLEWEQEVAYNVWANKRSNGAWSKRLFGGAGGGDMGVFNFATFYEREEDGLWARVRGTQPWLSDQLPRVSSGPITFPAHKTRKKPYVLEGSRVDTDGYPSQVSVRLAPPEWFARHGLGSDKKGIIVNGFILINSALHNPALDTTEADTPFKEALGYFMAQFMRQKALGDQLTQKLPRAEARSSSLFPDGMPEGAAIGGISGYVLSGGDSEVTGIGAAAGAVLGMFFLDDSEDPLAKARALEEAERSRRNLAGQATAPVVPVQAINDPVFVPWEDIKKGFEQTIRTRVESWADMGRVGNIFPVLNAYTDALADFYRGARMKAPSDADLRSAFGRASVDFENLTGFSGIQLTGTVARNVWAEKKAAGARAAELLAHGPGGITGRRPRDSRVFAYATYYEGGAAINSLPVLKGQKDIYQPTFLWFGDGRQFKIIGDNGEIWNSDRNTGIRVRTAPDSWFAAHELGAVPGIVTYDPQAPSVMTVVIREEIIGTQNEEENSLNTPFKEALAFYFAQATWFDLKESLKQSLLTRPAAPVKEEPVETRNPYLDILQSNQLINGVSFRQVQEDGTSLLGFNEQGEVVAIASPRDEENFALQAADLVVSVRQQWTGRFESYPKTIGTGDRALLPEAFLEAIFQHNATIQTEPSASLGAAPDAFFEALSDAFPGFEAGVALSSEREEQLVGPDHWGKPLDGDEIIYRLSLRLDWLEDLLNDLPEGREDFSLFAVKAVNIIRRVIQAESDQLLYIPVMRFLEAYEADLIRHAVTPSDAILEGLGYYAIADAILNSDEFKSWSASLEGIKLSMFIAAISSVYDSEKRKGQTTSQILEAVQKTLRDKKTEIDAGGSPAFILLEAFGIRAEVRSIEDEIAIIMPFLTVASLNASQQIVSVSSYARGREAKGVEVVRDPESAVRAVLNRNRLTISKEAVAEVARRNFIPRYNAEPVLNSGAFAQAALAGSFRQGETVVGYELVARPEARSIEAEIAVIMPFLTVASLLNAGQIESVSSYARGREAKGVEVVRDPETAVRAVLNQNRLNISKAAIAEVVRRNFTPRYNAERVPVSPGASAQAVALAGSFRQGETVVGYELVARPEARMAGAQVLYPLIHAREESIVQIFRDRIFPSADIRVKYDSFERIIRETMARSFGADVDSPEIKDAARNEIVSSIVYFLADVWSRNPSANLLSSLDFIQVIINKVRKKASEAFSAIVGDDSKKLYRALALYAISQPKDSGFVRESAEILGLNELVTRFSNVATPEGERVVFPFTMTEDHEIVQAARAAAAEETPRYNIEIQFNESETVFIFHRVQAEDQAVIPKVRRFATILNAVMRPFSFRHELRAAAKVTNEEVQRVGLEEFSQRFMDYVDSLEGSIVEKENMKLMISTVVGNLKAVNQSGTIAFEVPADMNATEWNEYMEAMLQSNALLNRVILSGEVKDVDTRPLRDGGINTTTTGNLEILRPGQVDRNMLPTIMRRTDNFNNKLIFEIRKDPSSDPVLNAGAAFFEVILASLISAQNIESAEELELRKGELLRQLVGDYPEAGALFTVNGDESLTIHTEAMKLYIGYLADKKAKASA